MAKRHFATSQRLVENSDILRVCKNLPRDYKVQVVAAVIEDEGRIEAKSGSIRIAMKDYNIVNAIAEIMDDLCYERSNIIKTKNRGFRLETVCCLFSIHLRVLGAHMFYNDLNSTMSKYGELAGLWKKQKQLNELVLLNNGDKARGEKVNGELAVKVINFMKKNDNLITYKELKQFLDASHQRVGSVIRRLCNKRIINKEARGIYKLIT